VADVGLPAPGRRDPFAYSERRPVSNVLRVAAFKVRDPIRMLVEMEADDLSWLALMLLRLHGVRILGPEGEPSNAGRLPS
jgi:hypothetical protein